MTPVFVKFMKILLKEVAMWLIADSDVALLYVFCCVNSRSVCSGLVSASLGTPADVVKRRMMNQKYINGRCTHYSYTF